MARGELTAHQTAGQLGGLMSIMAAGVVGGVVSSANNMAARRKQSAVHSYADALARATDHAAQMEIIALEAMTQIADLEAKVASLTAACAQRQAHIEILKGRVRA